MNRRRVLVVEDDDAIREGIVDALGHAGYVALEAADGYDGMASAVGADIDLLLLDLVLPGLDGLDILRAVRKKRAALPVIILTAKGDEQDRVRGLHSGADDYVVKPFSVRELLARVEAVLRRAPEANDQCASIAFEGGEADLASGAIVFHDGERVELSDREGALLRYLAVNAGRTVPREELLARVWGLNAPGIETRTVDVHVAKLREKLRDTSAVPGIIQTIRGKGYCFNSRQKQ